MIMMTIFDDNNLWWAG